MVCRADGDAPVVLYTEAFEHSDRIVRSPQTAQPLDDVVVGKTINAAELAVPVGVVPLVRARLAFRHDRVGHPQLHRVTLPDKMPGANGRFEASGHQF